LRPEPNSLNSPIPEVLAIVALKKWVFAATESKLDPQYNLCYSERRGPGLELCPISWKACNLDFNKSANVAYCMAVKSNKGPAAEKDTIYQTCKRLIIGMDSFHEHFKQHFLPKTQAWKIRIMPIIITSAPLFFFENDPAKSKISDGRYEERVHGEPLPWLHYRWSSALAPDWDERSPVADAGPLKSSSFDILIVNSNHLGELLSIL